MNIKDNTVYFQGREFNVNNSMLLFLGSGTLEGKEYALWSLIAFNGSRINDAEHSEVYLDIEFATPLTYTSTQAIKLLDANDELFFSKIHHIRIPDENIKIEKQDYGTIQLSSFSKTADKIHFQIIVTIDNSLLELSYKGITKLIVIQ